MSTTADIVTGDRCTVAGKNHDPYHRGLPVPVARVMAVAEGYAMLRYKGAIPFTAPVKELRKVGLK